MRGKVTRTIEKHKLLNRGETVVAALSGGPDSVALLAVLVSLARPWSLKIIAAHFNHGLRGKESDADEHFCRTLAGELGVTFVSGSMGKTKAEKGISPEDFYRRKRYDFLNKIAREQAAQKIALGHTLNDQAETVLLNLLRGAGREGLQGILPLREERYIRPLIEVSRREVEAFLKKKGLAFRRDSSNKNRKYLRNRIRLELIPYLKKRYNPRIEENLARLAAVLRSEETLISRWTDRAMRSRHIQRAKSKVVVKADYLKSLSEAVRLRVLKKILEGFSSSAKGIAFAHVQSLDRLALKNESGKSITLPFGIEARCEYGAIIVEQKKSRGGTTPFAYPLKVPCSLYVRERNCVVRLKTVAKKKVDFSSRGHIYFDRDAVRGTLVIRNRREGDWFEPLGMTGRKKIKKLLMDRKIPREKRDDILLLADDVSVIWIENLHLSERVKITEKTKKVLELKIKGIVAA